MLLKEAMLLCKKAEGEKVCFGYISGGSFFPIRTAKVSNGKLFSAKSLNVETITSVGLQGLQFAFSDCTGLTGSVSFPVLTSIDDRGLFYAFYGCKGLTGSVSFPVLTSIGSYGLDHAFSNCTGLTGSVSFPVLTSIGSYGLDQAFYNCTGLTEVHFPAALSGNSQCTAFNMGCLNATVYFDL